MRESYRLEINNQGYALGLWWHPVADGAPLAVGRQILADDADAVEQVFDAYCSYQDDTQGIEMVGLGTFERGVSSLAAVLSPEVPTNTLLFVKLSDNRGWIFSKRQYLNPEHGDQVLSRSEADKLYARLSREQEWDLFEVWEENKLRDTVFELVPASEHKLKKLELRSLAIKRFLWRALILGGLVLALIYAYSTWQHARPRPEPQVAPSLPGESPAERKARLQRENFPREWESLPRPSTILEDVRGRTLHLEIGRLGWSLISLAWEKDGYHCLWARQPGAAFHDAPGKVLPGNEDVVETIEADALPDSAKRGAQELLALSEALVPLLDLGRTVRTPIETTWAPPKQIVLKGSQKETVIAPYRVGTFNMHFLSALHIGLGEGLDRIPGLVLRQITWSNKGWTISGELYVKN